MAGIVALSYSDALYALAEEADKTVLFKEQLCFVREQCRNNDDFFRLMTHPKIHKKEKKQVIADVFESVVDHTVLNFMKLLIDKGRFRDLPDIAKEFEKRYRRENNIVVAYVKSARELSKEETKRLCAMLEKKLAKHVELRLSLDRDLLAGIRVKVNDVVLDYTAWNRLENLKHLASARDQRKESECECE